MIEDRSEHVGDQDGEAHAFAVASKKADEDHRDCGDHAVNHPAGPRDRHRDGIRHHIGAAEENAAREEMVQEISEEINAVIADVIDETRDGRQNDEGPKESGNDAVIGRVADEKVSETDENRDLADLAIGARRLAEQEFEKGEMGPIVEGGAVRRDVDRIGEIADAALEADLGEDEANRRRVEDVLARAAEDQLADDHAKEGAGDDLKIDEAHRIRIPSGHQHREDDRAHAWDQKVIDAITFDGCRKLLFERMFLPILRSPVSDEDEDELRQAHCEDA